MICRRASISLLRSASRTFSSGVTLPPLVEAPVGVGEAGHVANLGHEDGGDGDIEQQVEHDDLPRFITERRRAEEGLEGARLDAERARVARRRTATARSRAKLAAARGST